MLKVDPKERFSAQQCLEHEYFKIRVEEENLNSPLPLPIRQSLLSEEETSNALKKLIAFRRLSTLKLAAMNFMVKTFSASELRDNKKVFESLDTNGDGMIDQVELLAAFKKYNLGEQQKAEVQAIIDKVDYDGNKMISYSEFLTGVNAAKDILHS